MSDGAFALQLFFFAIEVTQLGCKIFRFGIHVGKPPIEKLVVFFGCALGLFLGENLNQFFDWAKCCNFFGLQAAIKNLEVMESCFFQRLFTMAGT